MSSNIQNKILNYEVIPPAGVWKKIEEALDESELVNEFPSRLYEAEVTAPVTAWNKITTALDAEQEITIPERRRVYPLLKYAAAAVVIGLLAWGGLQLLNNKPGNKAVAKQEILHSEKNSPELSADQNNNRTNEDIASFDNISSDEARNDAALEASKKTYAKLDMPVKSRIKEIASGFYFTSSLEAENMPNILPNDEITTGSLANRYITLMTPEGNIIRMSKKLTDMVCCVSGEDEDKACKDQIKKWREKIVCSPTCHTAGSFMNMLDLVEALQD